MGIAAQVSLYPLGGADIAAGIDQFLTALDEHGLDYEVGSMSTVVSGEADAVFEALRDGFARAADGNAIVMVATVSNTCPVI